MQAFYSWLRGHPILVDSVLGLFVAAFGLGMLGFPYLPRVEASAFVVAMTIPVCLRRRYPVGAFAAVVIVGGIEVLVLARPIASDLSVVILLYTLAAYRPRRLSVPGMLICLLGSALAIVRWAPQSVFHSLYTLGEVGAVFGAPALTAWLLGDLMHWRRGYYDALEERAARLERERGAQAQIAAAAERARIARELHDVVAHNVSVMVVQADGASYALDTAPERAREALETISSTGRQALAEMRSLVGVLRSGDDPEAELAPQPGIEQLTGLLEQARASGLPVSFTVEGVPRALAAGPALAAYRVVQESLTNARKHAGPTATAAVTLRFCEDRLVIKVTDDGRGARGSGARPGGGAGPGSGADPRTGDGLGHGLVGMRERVEAFGGSVVTGPRAGGGWRVAATLPMSDTALGAAS
ncbi:MAG TPA: histidine kinase [Trebonia sp.]|nr:histidine kinase [Trebonia sp.]